MADQDAGLDLEPGERVLWRGRPDPRRLAVPADAFWIPFSMAWTAFAVFWTVVAVEGAQARNSAMTAIVEIIGTAFIAFGAYQLIGRFVAKHVLARSRSYVLTDQRAIIVGLRGRAVDLAGRVADARVRRGRLDVVFRFPLDRRAARQMMFVESYRNTGLDFFLRQNEWLRSLPPTLGFHDVEDVAGLRAALAERFGTVTRVP